MIRMILADDEPVIIQGIQKLIDFSSMGIEIVSECTDGKSAMENILRLEPDLALLDISMPGMTGVEIIKECSALGIPTKIIFISGFQDFEYAKAAVSYGALDYLLKPVIREELLRALGKYTDSCQAAVEKLKVTVATPERDYSGLFGKNLGYLPVLTELVFGQEETSQNRKLVTFSLLSYIEEELEREKLGIVFEWDRKISLVLKADDLEKWKNFLACADQFAEAVLHHEIGFIVGKVVHSMDEMQTVLEECQALEGYLFFRDKKENCIISADNLPNALDGDWERFMKLRERLIESLVSQNYDMVWKQYEQFTNFLRRIAGGKKEDACFFFCTLIRMLEERFLALGLQGLSPDMRELLREGRECLFYYEMTELYKGILNQYVGLIREVATGGENQSFLKAKAYIENHYHENLTLGVMADVVHMNQHYFSSFFKKNSGENFKDYLARVRIGHAVALLLGTDMKAYEIASKVGFGDVRVFSENFQRIYHETPGAFRKRGREGIKNGPIHVPKEEKV